MPEQDDLADPDMHMVYPGPGSSAKMTSTLPSLSEMTGSLGHGSTENVMENLLDNLNLLSPKNQGSAGGPGSSSNQSSPSNLLQGSPGYVSYSNQQPQQDYRKCMYGQPGMGSLSSMSMQSLDSKPSYNASPGPMPQFGCTPGLLKELLTTDTDPHTDMMPSVDTVVTQPATGRGHMLPPYGNGRAELMGGGASHGHVLSHSHQMHGQAQPTSLSLNGRTLHPLSGLSHTGRVGPVKPPMSMQYGASGHMGGGGPGPGGLSYCNMNGNGYGPGPNLHTIQHMEKLPSDLDGMPVERFECDMESILHDTLMDGDTLDFGDNFDSMTQQGFPPHGVKTTTHSWVSG